MAKNNAEVVQALTARCIAAWHRREALRLLASLKETKSDEYRYRVELHAKAHNVAAAAIERGDWKGKNDEG